MRRIIFLTVAAVLLSPCTAWAALMVQEYNTGQKVTLDTNTGYYWYWNLQDFVSMNYDQQILEIAGLGTYGHIASGWHMATRADMDTIWDFYTGTQINDAFGGTLAEGTTGELLIGRYEERPDGITYLHFAGVIQNGGLYKQLIGVPAICDDSLNEFYGAWVVTDQMQLTAPLPPAVILAATGLLSSTLGLKRLRRKHQG